MALTPMMTLAAILIMAAVTLLTRVAPFVLFDRQSPPKAVLYMGKVLPPAVIAMLVIYCFRNIDFVYGGKWIPELVAASVVVLLHLWKRNNLLSIFGGTALYMVLIQSSIF